MDRYDEIRLATLLEMHEEICKEIGTEEFRMPNNGEDYIRGLKEARNIVEGEIHELAEE